MSIILPTPVQKISAFSGNQRKIYLALLCLGIACTSAFGFWWILPKHLPHNFTGLFHIFDYFLFLLLTYVVWYQIVNECFSWFIAGFMEKPKPLIPPKGLKVAFLTAFVPGSEPYDILEKTLSAMVSTKYPHDTWLLDEGDDPIAKKICLKYNVKHFSRNGSEKYNTPAGIYKAKTKGGNYNAWFDQFGNYYDVVAQLDVDFVPKKEYLMETLGYFRDPDVAFVGTPQIYGNTKDSWIVQGAAEQSYNFYGSMQKGFFGADMTLFIGANHVLRVEAYNDINGYSGHIVEDHLTGMKFYARRWKSVYVPKTLAIGEGPSTWHAYFSQQMRWAYGLIDILFRHSPKLFNKMEKFHIFNYFLLQQYYFYGIAQVIGVFLLFIYFFLGIQSTSMSLNSLLALYIPLLFYQQVFFIWLQRFNINPKKEKGFMIRGRILNWAAWPIYFMALLGVIAGRRLSYVVTPKGNKREATIKLGLFIPHFILGSITFSCLIAAIYTDNRIPQLLFWAILNTLIMYSFVFSEVMQIIYKFFEETDIDFITKYLSQNLRFFSTK
ncbi:glycosyltransferase [Candidatus Gottesmanbacteria bacterium]|nr:glycosyltransferase [Candidatus Gottesmanbacteria bacterium]